MEINIFFCMGAVIITAVCVFILWKSSMKQKTEYDNLLNSYRQLEELNLQLRAQRHDYLNQLHVIAGLVEVEEYGELQKYIEPLLLDQEKTGKAIRTRSSAVNALFAAKMNEAEKAGVAFYLEVNSALEKLPLPDWDLVRILSNLLDNAALTLIIIILVVLAVLLTICLIVIRKKADSPLVLHQQMKAEDAKIGSEDLTYLIGKEGIAISDLRPAGTGKFEGVEFDVRAEGHFIEKGSDIRITRISAGQNPIL